jgi:EAL domain-containing protein (putative c-di-GMP-specific phosphodiesterase class I)
MGKRQTRIFNRDILKNKSVLLNLEVNLLLKSGIALHGLIIEITEQMLVLKDLRMKKHLLPIQLIEEIMLDKETLY